MHISGKIKATFFGFLDGTAVGSMEHRLEPATGVESVVSIVRTIRVQYEYMNVK